MIFIDKVKIKLSSGRGGNGMVAWHREKYVDKGGPSGGDGGAGGNVYVIGNRDMTTLMDFQYQSIYKAGDGENGHTKNQHGKCGKDLIIKVPLGTVIKDLATGKAIADITEEDKKILIAKGGRGGRGNARFATSQQRAPQYCEPGEAAVERNLEMELKLIADVGLLGMPNAGKSTFISVVSSAKPKIADYPFTTLTPNLGVVKKPDGDGFVIADIPGLIEGAAEGIGLGHQFLRHVERCRFLIHIVDLTADDPLNNYKLINQELQKYGTRLSDVYQVVLLNKIDAVDVNTKFYYFNEFKKLTSDVFLISAATKENLDEFMNFLYQKVEEIPKPELIIDVEEDVGATDNDDSGYSVYKVDKKTFVVDGGKIIRLANVTDAKNFSQINRFQNILTAMGVFEALENAGIKDGDSIKIGHLEFDYYK